MTTLSDARVLVTGGSGYLGEHVRRSLAARGARAIPFSRTPTPGGIVGDVRHFEDVARATAGQDAIVHLAVSPGYRSAVEPLWDAEVNILGTLNVLRAARESGRLRVIHASTAHVYARADGPVSEEAPTRPTTIYGAGKLAAEHYVITFHLAYGVPAIILRFPTLYGPAVRGSVPPNVVARFTQQALAGETLVLRAPPQHPLDLLHVTDAAEAVSIALEEERAVGEIYNIGSGEPTSLGEIAEIVVRETGSRSAVRVDVSDDGVPSPVLDVRKARRELRFRPTVRPPDGVAAFARSSRENAM